MKKIVRIGTRSSELALWQAHLVQQNLSKIQITSEIVEVSSKGDEILDKPLHEIGGIGLFTKSLDEALLQGKIDIAVHSMKDVPTDLPKGIVQVAVMKRGPVKDILVFNNKKDTSDLEKVLTIATGSLRRKAQWLKKYPEYKVVDLRGNVNTRLRKLYESNWQGAVFAEAGLTRIDLLPKNFEVLDWMIPAPAQGAVMVVALDGDINFLSEMAKLNCEKTEKATYIERAFMKTLEGGCTAPIGAHAKIEDENITFDGILIDLDGSQSFEIHEEEKLENWENFGKNCALKLLNSGGSNLMKKIKSQMSH
ncbi:hydroxymethylbilane synthase [Namhaeicola litoreus]|uniref:Hydroxymethylbilane synthase n=1 Tax=Namhaeicola litoreus TaxID=1052145 RepID=A0ABW3Y185_9FLAO